VAPRTHLVLRNVDSGRVIASRHLVSSPSELLWSADGRRLAVVGGHGVAVFDGNGAPLPPVALARPVGAAAFEPGSHRLTVVLRGRRSDAVTVDLDRPAKLPVEIFSGSGRFSELAWAPNGRWLLIAWPTADQWLFVQAGDGRAHAVAGVSAQFSPGRRHGFAPVIDGWCCEPGLG
jgi:hypothetical protein